MIGSSAHIIFKKLTDPFNKPIIGNSEVATIALAYTQSGFLASNNMKDVARYVKEYKL